jgi:mRNA interferase YafQ
MRRIEITTAFKRDYRRIQATPKHRNIEASFREVVSQLAQDTPLAIRHKDHPLAGEWSDHRDCHIKPDLVLIYRKHSELGALSVRRHFHLDLITGDKAS